MGLMMKKATLKSLCLEVLSLEAICGIKQFVTLKSLGIAHLPIVNYGKRENRFSSASNAFRVGENGWMPTLSDSPSSHKGMSCLEGLAKTFECY
jgi:hypothetical protein